MNKAKLKTYAPQARKDFIAAVMARANLLGISEKNGKLEIAPSEKRGDVTLIAGQAWPAKVHEQRERLIKRMQKTNFGETAEAIAYTWFNRFAALRFMEIHDYLGHGHRVLSSREGGLPEIIAHATELVGTLPGLNGQQVADMKLAGNMDGELYRLLLVAQCNALSSAMPFLFERIDDESELLLPGNLERTDSVVAKLVGAIDEEDWNEVEVIGWLYQYYISEKKDEVIGKVVKSEDIPAATQLFTPNWIVQYLVQNSVGRLWLMANPTSTLKSQWPYYIEPAKQTPEVLAQLDALIQTRMAEDGGSLNPESITVLDPACGSGHILVEAYEVLKAIYLERGYQTRAIPRLILENNLYGLDIDDRAVQLAGFVLMMKARADDRRLLDSPLKLNVLSLQESKGLDLDEFAGHLKPYGISRNALGQLLDTFSHAKTFGSLIQIPEALDRELNGMAECLEKANQSGDVFARAAAQDLMPMVTQAAVLAMKFDAVVANPPYIGSKYHAPALKSHLRDCYAGYEKDVFSAFIYRNLSLCKVNGYLAFMTPQVWMFITSYEQVRARLIDQETILSLIQPEYHAFFDSAYVSICIFCVQHRHLSGYRATFIDLSDFYGADLQPQKALEAIHEPECKWRLTQKPDDFSKVPGSPLAFWLSDRIRNTFTKGRLLGELVDAKQGLATGSNDLFVRYWHEVDHLKIGFAMPDREAARRSGRKWFPYNKGGDFRKWYGNQEYLVNWEDDGREVRAFGTEAGGRARSRAQNTEYYFSQSLSWSDITSGPASFRIYQEGFIHDVTGMSAFRFHGISVSLLAAFCNTPIVISIARAINPTVHFQIGNFVSIPYLEEESEGIAVAVTPHVDSLIAFSRDDWDAYERSWAFQAPPIITGLSKTAPTLEAAFVTWFSNNRETIAEVMRLEEENNRLFIEAYGLAEELSPDVPHEQITLTVNPAYRYGGNLSDEDQSTRFRQDTMAELIAYAIGCMMGRYSLDEPGLIYAHAGNVGFDASRYKTFSADADGIVPITDDLWFDDDATNRIREFLQAVWGAETLEENMAWLAESLVKKASETSEETIRRYLSASFFKDHLQTYKKRPIYWLFSSGKQGAFQALVYLHRYHEGTLARMRAEYVVPLTGKMQSRIEMLEKDKDAASSTAARNKIAKQIETLKKKHVELLAYDEKLRHYADMRISLDLDDGVKVNYGKFGDLLAEVKAVTGGTGED